MASLALFTTFPTYINYIGQTKANPAAALTIISFGITWLALLGILLVGRRPGRGAVQVGWCPVMAYLELHEAAQALRRLHGHPRDRRLHRGGRVPRAARSVRLREDDRAPHRRGLRAPDLGPGGGRGQGRDERAAEPARHGHGLPGVRLFPNMNAADNVEFGLRVRGRGRVRAAQAGRRAPRARRPLGGREALSAPALGRDAAAGRARASARHRAARPPPRRAALRARRAGARPAPGGDPPPADAARDHDALRHARPGGGALDLRPRRRPLPRAASSRSACRRRSTTRPDAVRRRVHRHDEPPRGNRRGRPGEVGSRNACCASTARADARAASACSSSSGPEILELQRATNGAGLGGEVVAHIFLGAITRVKVDAGEHELSADLPGTRAMSFPSARASARRFRPRAPGCSRSASTKRLPGKPRTVAEDPGHAELGELAHPLGLVHGEDGGREPEPPERAEIPRPVGVLEADPPEPAAASSGLPRLRHRTSGRRRRTRPDGSRC